MSILEMSLMGGAMVLCILLLRWLARGRLNGIVLSAMWAVAVIRLVVPVQIPSVLSIAGLVRQAGHVTAVTMPAQPAAYTAPVPPLVIVWLCGAALCAIFFLTVGIKQRRVLKTALPAPMTPELKAALSSQRLKRKVSVYTSDRISTPLTYGLIRPRIVLPSPMKLSGQELNFVMAHEGGHIKRLDALKKSILLAAVCLHWFNPLAWLMSYVCRRDMELECDRRVVKACGPKARANYAKTLLGMEERKRFSGMLMECLSVGPLETRIRSIMAGKKSSAAGALAALAVYACAAAVFATSPGALPSLTVNSVLVTTTPISTYDLRHLSASDAAVYVMSGDVITAGQAGLKITAPYITVSSLKPQATLAQTASSVSVKYGGTIAVAAEDTAVPGSVYSMVYTVKDSDIQN